MLPAHHRMRRASEFRLTTRRGRRAGAEHLAVHLLVPSDTSGHPCVPPAPWRAGLVVPRSVGGAVQRTSVKRRLRHVLAAAAPSLPAGSLVVVRAAPSAHGAPSAVLAHELDQALARCLRPRGERGGAR